MLSDKNIDINEVCQLLIDGATYRTIAQHYKIHLSELHTFLSKPEHSARAHESLIISAETYSDKAEQVLLDAVRDGIEMQRARELSQYYKWKASKRNPRRYSDKIDVTTDGQKITSEIDYSKLSTAALKEIAAQSEGSNS